MSDAQMSMFRVVRPFDSFEAKYQDVAGTVPVAFPGALDPLAGKPGYASNLMAGIAVPLGARVLIQIPMTVDMYTPEAKYAYQLIWRTRNATDVGAAILAGRLPSAFHLPSQEPGRAEFEATGERIFIPGASDVELFTQDEPTLGTPVDINAVSRRYVPQITVPWAQPLLPDGNEGIWQQGVYQFSSNVNCAGPTWVPILTTALGDELVIMAYKIDSGSDWDFAGDDQGFSNTYGNNAGGLPNNPNVGIIISTGNADA